MENRVASDTRVRRPVAKRTGTAGGSVAGSARAVDRGAHSAFGETAAAGARRALTTVSATGAHRSRAADETSWQQSERNIGASQLIDGGEAIHDAGHRSVGRAAEVVVGT